MEKLFRLLFAFVIISAVISCSRVTNRSWNEQIKRASGESFELNMRLSSLLISHLQVRDGYFVLDLSKGDLRREGLSEDYLPYLRTEVERLNSFLSDHLNVDALNLEQKHKDAYEQFLQGKGYVVGFEQ